MLRYLLFLLWPFAIFSHANAQRNVTYTNDNSIFITIEGTGGLYEYTTREMLVRYNENRQVIECVVNITSLLPTNDSSATVIPQDIFFAANYPELLIEIDAPVEKINAGNIYTERLVKSLRMFVQDIPIEQTAPVTFTPDDRSLKFSTTFEILLTDYNIAIPAKYIPMLTGRIRFAIRNARSIEFFPR